MSEAGVCIFAYNNEQLDYVKLAVYCGQKAKKHLGVPIALITDQGSFDWLKQSHDMDEIKSTFEYVIVTDDEMDLNPRVHYDSPWTEFSAPFKNGNKHKVFEYTPFDKTILLDVDYIVNSDNLKYIFETNGVCMFEDAHNLRNEAPGPRERYLFDAGIKMWWSTVIYFDKSLESKLFFDLWAHIAENYDYYQYLYNFPTKLFRTDYCVSIAVHILSGMTNHTQINSFPVPLVNMDQKDELHEVREDGEWIFLANDPAKNWQDILVKISNTDIHMMNKRSLERKLGILKLYDE